MRCRSRSFVSLGGQRSRPWGAHALERRPTRITTGGDQTARLMRVGRDRRGQAVEASADHSAGSGVGAVPGSDLEFVPTWAGLASVCFIVDAFSRMIVGWRVESHTRTEMVLDMIDMIDMARWPGGQHHPDSRCHSDAGSRCASFR